jgi:hypothetical protein
VPSPTKDADFQGLDVGPQRTPYCCTFHWFRAADGRIIGVDVIRSDDIAQLSLRTYIVEPDGSIKGLAYAAPTHEWEPFATDSRPPLDGPKPSLGRGVNWIAGSLQTSGQHINRVVFDLNVVPQSRVLSSSALWELDLVYLAATDFTTVHTTGWMEIDDRRFAIDSYGPVSIHFGAHLPSYGYCATVQNPSRPDAPSILLGSVAGDDFRVFGKHFRDITFTYAYGDNGVPHRMYNIGHFEHRKIPLNFLGHLQLADVQPFIHLMLGVKAVTATAQATLHLPFGREVPLGEVILDFRGPNYTDTLL